MFFSLGPGATSIFDPALVVDDDLGRDEGQAFFLDLAGQALDLPAVEKEPFRPEGVMVESVGGFIRADVAIEQEHFAVADLGVAFFEADPAFLDGFDLAPEKLDPRFERFR